MEKTITCINCPLGCMLTVSVDGGKAVEVKGHGCKRGIDYGITECENPVRTVTSTVPVRGGPLQTLPVKTEKPVPKDKIFACIRAIKDIEAVAPIRTGDVLAENICGTGVNLVACRDVETTPDE